MIVAYGIYANEVSKQNYEQWKELDAKERAKIGDIKEYQVKFIGLEWAE